MVKRKVMAFFLAMSLAVGSIGSISTYAASSDFSEDEMKTIILAMKNRFGIGEKYTEFDADRSGSGDSEYWCFNWSTEDGSDAISVSCDAKLRVKSYSKYGNRSSNVAPELTQDECLKGVEKFLSEKLPELKGSYRLTEVSGSRYNCRYTYYFVRVENGIDMPDNTVRVGADYVTGEVTYAYVNWNHDVKVPSAEKLISKEEAAAKLSTKVDMTLKYFRGWDEDGNEKIFLAYVPDKSYIAVDAISGKIYTEKLYWGSSEEADMTNSIDRGFGLNDSKAEAAEAVISEAEQKKIDELKGLISKDEAIAAVRNNKYLLIDDSINYVDASVSKAGDHYVWYITMSDQRPVDYENDDYYRAYARASVNAETGELLSFYASVKDLDSLTADEVQKLVDKHSKSDCKKIFEKFLKEESKDRFSNVEFTNSYTVNPIFYDRVNSISIYSGYSFNYVRVNEKVPFEANCINGSVDSITGKVCSYYFNWSENVEFPSTKNVIGKEKAFMSYTGYEGFDLVYEIVTNYKQTESFEYKTVYTVRLVYRTQISPAYVDADTGKQLDYNGNECVKTVRNFEYTDIAGSKYERTIKLLAGMGIGFEGSEFKPNQVITRKEMAQLIGDFTYVNAEGLKLDSDKKLTRQYAAKIICAALDLEKLAALDIYKTGYSDENKIAKGFVGYVALAKGLNLIGAASGKKFKPTEGVTRGEAAQIVLDMFNVNR